MDAPGPAAESVSLRLVSAAGQPGGGGTEPKFWDIDGGHELLTLKNRASEINSLAFSAEGRRLIAAGLFPDPKVVIQVWHATPVPQQP